MAAEDVHAVLDHAAQNGELDYSKWPGLISNVLARLDHIVYSTFLIPTPPPLSTFSHLASDSPTEPISSGATQEQPSTDPSASANHVQKADTKLPEPLQVLYDGIKQNLTSSFSEKPPYTVQRFAELLIHPEKHYRTLPAYLRAVDRIVSVSSTADVFPLPFVALDNNVILGSGGDDFNGAALTRIPWLKDEDSDWPPRDSADMMGVDEPLTGMNTDLRTESTSVIDGPNGAGSIETVSVDLNGSGPGQGAVKPDEHSSTPIAGSEKRALEETADRETISPEDTPSEAAPHARGPEEIGMEDMGPQASSLTTESGPADSIQAAERAVGRPGEGERVVAEEELPSTGDADAMSLSNNVEEGEQSLRT